MEKKIKNRYLKDIAKELPGRIGPERAERVMREAWSRWDGLCRENADQPRAMHPHTRERIYPAIAVFHSLLGEGVPRSEAAGLLCAYYEKRSEPVGRMIRRLMRIPELYRRVPLFFVRMTHKAFGEAAGFRATWHAARKDEMRFDMTVCPYHDICVRYGAPELVRGFCRADDICYGNMHPKLEWGRTKTLGMGGDCCDFRLTIRESGDSRRDKGEL